VAVLDEHLDGPLTHLGGVRGFPWHCSILSREGASRIPGPIQLILSLIAWFESCPLTSTGFE